MMQKTPHDLISWSNGRGGQDTSNCTKVIELMQLVEDREVLCHRLFFFFFLPTLMAYGSSQARGPVGTVATILCHSHGNAGSEPHLQLNTSACSSARSLTH